MPYVSDMLRCPLRPSLREVRAAAAAVLNADVTTGTMLSISDSVIILAYKLLSDVSIETDYIVAILRYFRQVIHDWNWPSPLILSINDNRYAVLVGPHDSGGIDFKAGIAVDATKLPAPLLQASVNLSGLSALPE